jgi:hypothetical protein
MNPTTPSGYLNDRYSMSNVRRVNKKSITFSKTVIYSSDHFRSPARRKRRRHRARNVSLRDDGLTMMAGVTFGESICLNRKEQRQNVFRWCCVVLFARASIFTAPTPSLFVSELINELCSGLPVPRTGLVKIQRPCFPSFARFGLYHTSPLLASDFLFALVW